MVVEEVPFGPIHRYVHLLVLAPLSSEIWCSAERKRRHPLNFGAVIQVSSPGHHYALLRTGFVAYLEFRQLLSEEVISGVMRYVSRCEAAPR